MLRQFINMDRRFCLMKTCGKGICSPRRLFRHSRSKPLKLVFRAILVSILFHISYRLMSLEHTWNLNNPVWAAGFLGSLGIMDYSLLVGFSRREGMLIVGLVDYLRQYTWDKQVESWVKASGLLGGAGKEPTIVSPNQYAQRFRQMVLSHLSSVP